MKGRTVLDEAQRIFSGIRSLMNDRRVCAIRNALEDFVESVDATSRIARWGNIDPVPDSLRHAAAELGARRKTANDLAMGGVSGAPVIVRRLSASSSAIKRLSNAYEEFLTRKRDPENDVAIALKELDAAIDSANETLRMLD
jgi:hypothetical protein